jgi:hypothetical protein
MELRMSNVKLANQDIFSGSKNQSVDPTAMMDIMVIMILELASHAINIAYTARTFQVIVQNAN